MQNLYQLDIFVSCQMNRVADATRVLVSRTHQTYKNTSWQKIGETDVRKKPTYLYRQLHNQHLPVRQIHSFFPAAKIRSSHPGLWELVKVFGYPRYGYDS